MAKDPYSKITKDGDFARKRYGSTTGASKGTKPAPPAKVKVKPGKTTKLTWERKF